MSDLRIRKWWSAGTEVTIRLTEMIGDDDGKRLHEAVHAFSKALSASAASPESLGVSQDAIKTDPSLISGEGSSVAESTDAPRFAAATVAQRKSEGGEP